MDSDSAESPLARFVEQVDRNLRLGEPEPFFNLEEEFRRLVHSGFLVPYLNVQIEALTRDPGHLGDWRQNQLVVHRGRGYALTVWLFDKPRQHIHTSSFYGMFAPVGKDSLCYDIYKLPPHYRNDVFDPGVKLEPAGSGITAPGGILLLQSDEYAYDFKFERPLAVLKFTTSSFHSLEWLFNKDNLHAWQANDSELKWTQLRVASYILGRLAHQSSVEPLEQLATHPHHAVRWAAIQSLGRLSRTAALAQLENALDDPHPHVRRAAGKTLQQIRQKPHA